MTDSHLFAPWPPSPIERDLRSDLDAACTRIAAVIALAHHAATKDGRVPVGELCRVLDIPRPKPARKDQR